MSDLLERVRSLILLSEHPETPAHEADSARKMADSLMFKYSLDEAMLNEAKPASERTAPCRLNINIASSGDPLNAYFSTLGSAIGEHTRCRVIWLRGSAEYRQTDRLAVYGYKADTEYFNLLYTTIFLHMSGIFFPKPDPQKTFDENLIELRKLGMNWLQMAEVYGWRKIVPPEWYFGMEPDKEYWRHNLSGELKTNFQIGGQFKRATHKAYASAGLKLEVISSVASRRAEGTGYRSSVASGYVGRVTERLRAARGERDDVGSEVVLMSAARAIDDMINADFPNLETIKNKDDDFNPEAYMRGIRFGNEADLNTSSRMGGNLKGELGG